MVAEEQIIQRLLNIMGSSEFLVIINGMPKRHNNSLVYARIQRSLDKQDRVVFYTKYKSEGKTFQSEQSSLEDVILTEALNPTLFGYNFSSWLSGKGLIGNISVNNGLKLLFIETPMYTIFKNHIPVRENLNIKFQPTVNGKELGPFDLSYLLDQFRLSGLMGLLELDRIGITRKMSFKVPKFYKGNEGFFLASVREENLFNPFFDDKMIYSSIKDRVLIKEIREKEVYNAQIGTSVTYLSYYQASKGLGIKTLVPFDFRIFTSIMAGLVMDPDSVPSNIPHKLKRVMRLAVVSEEFPPTISLEEYEQSSEYKKSHYVESTTFNTFLMINFEFFRRRGFTDLNKLLDVMAEAVLA
jgi:hypothetical protein